MMKQIEALIKLVQFDIKQTILAVVLLLSAWIIQRYLVKPMFQKIIQFLNKKDSHFHVHIYECYEKAMRHAIIVAMFFVSLFICLGIPLQHEFLNNILASILIFYGFLGLYRLLDFYAKHPSELNLARKVNSESVLLPLFCRYSKYGFMAIAFVFISYQWGFNLTGLIAGLGIGGIALALGMKDVLSNMFGGMAVALDRPFSRGDWISTQDRKIEGLVEEINFRSTKILTFDKAILYVPNTVLANQPIINWTRREVRRVKFQLAIEPATPESHIRRAIFRITQVLTEHAGVRDDGINVFIDEITEAGLMLKVIYFTNTAEFSEAMTIKQEINFTIHRILKEEKVMLTPVIQQMQWKRVV
ncbi:mechanosensitive ion channel family protein [Brevibacillus sp. NPDC058079]|uniref:mechanosensitive ion channel family protein n=1 Tax=Brevibacillus sp. NPDC058079 TaxID=3346330 RepID=UPI0036EA9724